MRVAIEGCAHGELDSIYNEVRRHEQITGETVDLLLICGDVQTMRNQSDVSSMACPPKYRRLGTFWQYYAGIKKAHVPTVFIGGNHEASTYLWELSHGGWVAPNIYYMGRAGCIQFGGCFERPPLDESTMRSIYHQRHFDTHRLFLWSRLEPECIPDVCLSHDWPRGIEQHGDMRFLLKKKPYLKEEIERGTLNSGACERLLKSLQPRHWFSAHHHIRYSASFVHPSGNTTQFLALDKCLPKRRFLEFVSIETADTELDFFYDPDWLAVVKAMQPYFSSTRYQKSLPQDSEALEKVRECRQWVGEHIQDLRIPKNFSIVAPIQDPNTRFYPPGPYLSPQTDAFCQLLGIPNDFQARSQPISVTNPDEIPISSDEERVPSVSFATKNPDEIEIADDDF